MATLLVLLLLNGCAATVAQLSPRERSVIQSTTFKAPYKQVLKAVMGVFQDRGYIIAQADIETGLILTEFKQSSSAWEVMIGEIRTKMNAIISEIDATTTKVRLQGIIENQSFGGWQTVDLTKTQAEKTYNEYFTLIKNKLFP